MRLRLLAIFALLGLLGSGCWDVEDMDQRATVIALGLDAAPDNKVMASAQIALVETSPLALGTQTPDKPFHTITSLAKTAYGATTGLENKAAKTIFLGQLKTVVINAALAERGLKEYCGFLERFPQIPPQAVMVLTETAAQDILSVGLSSKFLPGLAIQKFITSKSKWDEAYPVSIWQFIKNIEVKPVDAYLPIISFSKEEQVYRSEGLGVFHRDRLAGKLSENESRMALLLMGKVRSAFITVPVPKIGEVTFRKLSAKCRITIRKSGPSLEFLVHVNARGFAAEITSDKANLTLNDIEEIEKATAQSLQKDMTDTILHLQKLNSDIIGFGDTVRATRPELWKSADWDEAYSRTRFQVKAKFLLERVGEYR